MNAWLLIAPVVFILALDLLAVALCRAAARADRMAERAFERRNGWRNRGR